jgi:uncharacterized phage protein (TIGR02218 family)
MRSASPALIALINAARASRDAQLIMADCYDFALLNGAVLSYTSVDVPITYNDTVYLANSVLVDGLKYKCSVGLNVDVQKITLSAKPTDLVGGVPFLAAVQNGLLDGCEISRTRVFLNSWSPADCAAPIGGVLLFKGRVGAIDSIGRTQASVTVNADVVLLNDTSMPRNLYSPQCVHVLYDSGCGLAQSAFTTAGTVGANPSVSYIPWAAATSLYAQGRIVFTSGANSGISANVKSATTSGLTLSYPLLEAPSQGDTFDVSYGCDHTMATCQSTFANLANFRGFPFIPPTTYSV